MRLIQPFDPSIPGASGTLDTLGVNPNEQLMLYNDSLYGLQLEFMDGSVGVIPPSWNKDYIIEKMPMGKVKWKVYNQIIASGYPITQVYGELYEAGEHVARVNAGMQRGFQITGGGASLTNATSVVNDGNPLGTPVIESTPTGVVASTLSFLNDGTVIIKGDIANTLTTIIQTVPGAAAAASSLLLGDATRNVEILGKLLIDGILAVTGNIVANGGMNIDTIRENGGGISSIDLSSHDGTVHFPKSIKLDDTIRFQVGANQKILASTAVAIVDASDNVNFNFNAPDGTNGQFRFWTGGTQRVHIDLNGMALLSGSLLHLSGGLSRIKFGHFTPLANGATITHGLGATPEVVLVNTDIAQPGSGTVGAGSNGATTFKITAPAAGAAGAWWFAASS